MANLYSNLTVRSHSLSTLTTDDTNLLLLQLNFSLLMTYTLFAQSPLVAFCFSRCAPNPRRSATLKTVPSPYSRSRGRSPSKTARSETLMTTTSDRTRPSCLSVRGICPSGYSPAGWRKKGRHPLLRNRPPPHGASIISSRTGIDRQNGLAVRFRCVQPSV